MAMASILHNFSELNDNPFPNSGAIDMYGKSVMKKTSKKPILLKKERIKRKKRAVVPDSNFHETFMNSIPEPAFLIDTRGTILLANWKALKHLANGSDDLTGANLFDMIPSDLARSGREHVRRVIEEKKPMQYTDECKGKIIHNKIYPVFNTLGEVEQLAVMGIDYTEEKESKKVLEVTTSHLKQTVEDLKKANQKILDQQKSVIEEERLTVLLQMAGATAHELNQPLTALLGNIEMLDFYKNDPDRLFEHISFIEDAGKRISDIVKKIQSIHHYETKPYDENTTILNLDQKIVILSVEDQDKDYEVINSLLSNHSRVHLARSKTVEEATRLLENTEFDLVFLDYMLPDGNGLDLLRIMNKKEIDTPVVVITAQGDDMIAAQIIQEGAYDYLPKDRISEKSISRIISNTLEKVRLKKEIKMAHKKMAEMSIKDELTRLYNRRYFNEVIEREVSRAHRYQTNMVLILADIDHFKNVNDTFGHLTGDLVLSELGGILKNYFRKSDFICRYGGEEFAGILPNSRPEKALKVCERLREIISKHRFKANNHEFNITLSIGISYLSGSDRNSAEELIAMADRSLYRAKKSGRNQVVI